MSEANPMDVPETFGGPSAPKQKRRRKVRRKRSTRPKPDVPREKADDLDGLTASKCCEACGNGHCVITDGSMCGHPYKATHHSASAEVLQRIKDARKRIAHQKVEAA